jgi:pimeloyl-ACP methyl ester carboxylesterase
MRWLAFFASVLALTSAQNRTTPQPREAYAELPGVRLFYIDTGGSGVPVVFMHAATGSSRVWEHQIPAFTKAGYRFIAFDRRGWGRSVTDAAGPQRDTAADDLLALVEELHIDRFHLVGTAAGAFVSIDFALSFPKRLRSVVIANSIGGVQDESFLALGRALRPPEFDALPPELREVGPSYRAANSDGTRRWVELEHVSRPPGPPAPAQPMRNRTTFAALETIAVPTLLLTGGADMYAPPAVQKLLAAHIKHAETVVVPDAGHSTYWEQPDAFNRTVLGFIRKH